MVVLSHSSLVAAVLTVLTPGVWWKRCTEHIQGLFALGCHSVHAGHGCTAGCRTSMLLSIVLWQLRHH